MKSRMVDQQMSSIPGRGQVKGMQLIRKYITDDNKAMAYAARHGMRYASKCKYYTKLDIENCYGSTEMEVFMLILRHDCGNDKIIWLWDTTLKSHHVGSYTGLMLGAPTSQWACQIMLSFIYRMAMALKYSRRGKDYKKINHIVMFMDDMLCFGSNRKQLLSAVRQIITYVKDRLGMTIKESFQIQELKTAPVDMMGYVIFRNGKVEMRERNYIRSKRMMIRFRRNGSLVLSQAKRLISYKGFYKHSDSRKARRELKADKIFNLCALVISKHDKEANDAQNNVSRQAGRDYIPATA